MTTKTCTNGHVMTGIGFGECPECEAPWIATPIVEEIVERFRLLFGMSTVMPVDSQNEVEDFLRTTLETYGNARYEEGVKAERERCKDLVVAHLRTNTYDGNDARVFKTTIEEVVKLLNVN